MRERGGREREERERGGREREKREREETGGLGRIRSTFLRDVHS